MHGWPVSSYIGIIHDIVVKQSKIMKYLLSAIVIAFGLSSCNTTIGFARDLRQAGEGLEKAAQGKNGGGDMGAPTY